MPPPPTHRKFRSSTGRGPPPPTAGQLSRPAPNASHVPRCGCSGREGGGQGAGEQGEKDGGDEALAARGGGGQAAVAGHSQVEVNSVTPHDSTCGRAQGAGAGSGRRSTGPSRSGHGAGRLGSGTGAGGLGSGTGAGRLGAVTGAGGLGAGTGAGGGRGTGEVNDVWLPHAPPLLPLPALLLVLLLPPLLDLVRPRALPR